MKIKLEFEKDDFYEMLKNYFKDTGWEAHNLEDVVAQFEDAFPGGIIVEAEVAGKPPDIAEYDARKTKVESREKGGTLESSISHVLKQSEGLKR